MSQKLYQKVIDFINQQINSGDLVIGDLIPSESQLSNKLNVSIGTVRKAIEMGTFTFFLYPLRHKNEAHSFTCHAPCNHTLALPFLRNV